MDVSGPNGLSQLRYRDARGAYVTAAVRAGIPRFAALPAARIGHASTPKCVPAPVQSAAFEEALGELLAGDRRLAMTTLGSLGFDVPQLPAPDRRP